MSTTIRIDDDVESYIQEHGKFGETHNDVLRRRLLDFKMSEQTYSKNDARNRYQLFGHSACAVVRWMGKEGWKYADARKVLDSLGLKEVSDVTIRCQLQWEQRGTPAELNSDQVKELIARK